MLTLSEFNHLDEPDQFFGYAEAYRYASDQLCRRMESDDSLYTWPNASVILMLAAHAVELFLKGALLKRNVEMGGHDIQQLAEKYREVFTEPELAWDFPFASPLSRTETIASMKQQWPDIDEAKLKEFMETAPAPSILYRYPVYRSGKKWRTLCGFTTATEFLSTLDQVDQDFKRIKLLLAH